MGLPRLERCCFVFDLQTGNIILGCINAFLSFCMFVIMIVAACGVGALEKDMHDDIEISGTPSTDEINMDAQLTGLYVMCVILVFLFLAKLLFDVFFIVGVIMERKGIIKAYFIMWIVFMILSMFLFFLNSQHWGWKTLFTELIHLGINFYVALVCHSYYVQLNTREEV